MTKKQTAKLARHNATLSFLHNNMELVRSSPAFLISVNNYHAKVANLNATSELEKQVVTGITKGVRIKKQTLAEQFSGNAALIQAMAWNTSNKALQEAVNFSTYDLFNFKNEDINKHCANILRAAKNNLTELKDYGIDQTSVDTMEASLLSYNALATAPRNARSEKHSHKLSIDRQMDELDDMLDNVMDNFVQAFKITKPEFYYAYHANRKIVDPAVSHSTLKGHLGDSFSGKPVINATVTVIIGGITYSGVTNKSGNYRIYIPQVGSCKVTAEHPGYETQEALEAVISLGKKTVLDILLAPKK